MKPQKKKICVNLRIQISGLGKDCRNSIADTLELLQFCAKPSK